MLVLWSLCRDGERSEAELRGITGGEVRKEC